MEQDGGHPDADEHLGVALWRQRTKTGGAAEAPEPESTPASRVEPTTPVDQGPKKVSLGGLGKGDIAGLVVGGVGAIAGGVLVGVGTRDQGGDLEGSGETTDFRPAGFAVLGVGLGGVVVGAVLLGVDRARARRHRSSSGGRVGRHFAGFTGVVRF